ncbi:pentapeptide repeat-containing protein [Nocardioides sp. URHA0020]|uniref:pentapeptide repeat-containing protein n=1 Tax=Nocardioides sp. URHA0020 TaxID=1380392 RepID=UPI000490067C|nr:hypothetical protein [Nocardioides sp. URHA0020]
MLKRSSNHLALVIALCALFFAMGGPAWAAEKINGGDIKASTVTGKQVKNSSLAGVDVKDGSLAAADVKNSSLTGADVKDSSLSGADLKNGSVGRSDLAPGSVTTGSFAGSAVAPAAVSAQSAASAQALPGVQPGDFSAAGGTGSTAGAFSLAVGRRAQAVNSGSFVWADGTDADFASTADNQFAVRAANGFLIANDAGNGATVPVGTRYRDNAVVAWARVTANGTLDSNFNVGSITRLGTGHYHVLLSSSLQSGFSLIPTVTPEVDEAVGNVPPTGAANVRLAATNQFASGSTFDVYLYNGSFASVDNDFQLVVTGR